MTTIMDFILTDVNNPQYFVLFPVNPEEVTIDLGIKTITLSTFGIGDVEIPQKRGPYKYSWDAFLPDSNELTYMNYNDPLVQEPGYVTEVGSYGPPQTLSVLNRETTAGTRPNSAATAHPGRWGYVRGWRPPQAIYVDLEKWLEQRRKLRFQITGTLINREVFIASLQHKYGGWPNRIQYSISLTEWRSQVIEKSKEKRPAPDAATNTNDSATTKLPAPAGGSVFTYPKLMVDGQYPSFKTTMVTADGSVRDVYVYADGRTLDQPPLGQDPDYATITVKGTVTGAMVAQSKDISTKGGFPRTINVEKTTLDTELTKQMSGAAATPDPNAPASAQPNTDTSNAAATTGGATGATPVRRSTVEGVANPVPVPASASTFGPPPKSSTRPVVTLPGMPLPPNGPNATLDGNGNNQRPVKPDGQPRSDPLAGHVGA